jgi:hypothetical protein
MNWRQMVVNLKNKRNETRVSDNIEVNKDNSQQSTLGSGGGVTGLTASRLAASEGKRGRKLFAVEATRSDNVGGFAGFNKEDKW